jgi:UDP-galactopyranose mutase
MTPDYLIVGSGLTGATIARMLADAGRDVLVVDRRSHLGGNVHDHSHLSGIRIHTYGPHYFRTSSDRIWQWANRFGEFFTYEARVLSDIGTGLAQWPPSKTDHGIIDWSPAFKGAASNLEESALSMMPRKIYELFVKGYNEKQWGKPCTELSPDLCKRFDVRNDNNNRLTPNAKYQGIPVNGYAAWMARMLDGIPAMLNYDYLQRRDEIKPRKLLIFTGAIDEFFGFSLGKLQYRGQKRRHQYLPDVGYAQPCGQVNNPLHSRGKHIRTLEWKHMMQPSYAGKISGSLITTETPFSPNDPSEYEYPFPDKANASLALRYKRLAESSDQCLITGRLGEYKYLDMDQAIMVAMKTSRRILTP